MAVVVVASEDPEVAELTAQVRDIVGLAYRLSKDIDKTVDDLSGFTPKIERRTPSATTYIGEERRSG